MIQTLEAVVDETGKIKLLTEVHLKKNRRALVTILDEETSAKDLRPFGLSKGGFVVPEDFDTPLPEDVLADLEN